MSYRSLLFGCMTSILCLACYGCGKPNQHNGGSPSPANEESSTGENQPAAPAGGTDDGSSSGEADVVSTEGWGNLKGKFIVTGAPEPAVLPVAGGDADHCGKFDLVDESVVAGPGGELANVVLTLYTKRGDEPPAPHESYAQTANASVQMANVDCRFSPHITLLRTSQKLDIRNGDTVAHNANFNSFNNPFNTIIPPGTTIEEGGFSKTERFPVSVSCNIHPWMKGYLIVSESPYMATSDEKGEFQIENLPAGKHTFTVWQEKSGYLSDVEVNGKTQAWERGRVEVIIKDGKTTDLGEVKVTYAKLAS